VRALDWVLLFLPVAFFSAIQLSFKQLGRGLMRGRSDMFLFTALHLIVSIMVLVIAGLRLSDVSLVTAGIAVLFGIFQLVNIASLMMAFERGPVSYTSLFYTAGMLIPVLVSVLAWGEPIKLVQVAGLGLLLASFYAASGPGAGSSRAARRASGVAPPAPGAVADGAVAAYGRWWLALALITFLSNGINMVLAKVQQRLTPGQEIREYIAIAFSVTALISFVLYFAMRRRVGVPFPVRRLPAVAALLAIIGGSNALANMIAIRLMGRLPGILVFPVLNGGTVLVVSALSVLLFRERLDRIRTVGLLAGTVGIVMVAMGN
jgi:drug/metabolite transporter (DMT)-like permease